MLSKLLIVLALLSVTFYSGKLESVYGDNISPLMVEVTYETTERLHVKIYDPNNERWEIPSKYEHPPISNLICIAYELYIAALDDVLFQVFTYS